MAQAVSVKTLPFEGVRIESETPLQFDVVRQRLLELAGGASIATVVGLAAKMASPEEYIRQVQEQFVGPSGFTLFTEIDHGAWIGLFGIRRRLVRIILGNPVIAITMIRHDLSAGLFVPVELLLTEKEGGTGTSLLYIRPSSLICVDDRNPELLAAARALDEKLAALVARAVEA